jgi:hypothetical protein
LFTLWWFSGFLSYEDVVWDEFHECDEEKLFGHVLRSFEVELVHVDGDLLHMLGMSEKVSLLSHSGVKVIDHFENRLKDNIVDLWRERFIVLEKKFGVNLGSIEDIDIIESASDRVDDLIKTL